jgi:hypothetical protein
MDEIWKHIPGYQYYQISTTGQIKSLDRRLPHNKHKTYMIRKGKLLTPYVNQSGYYIIRLCESGQIFRTIHSLVALTFIPNPENKPQVNHINGDKKDNRVENLEWVTNGENMKHAYRIGLKCNKGIKNPGNKLSENDILEIRNSNEKQDVIANRFNIKQCHVSSIKNKKTWRHIL